MRSKLGFNGSRMGNKTVEEEPRLPSRETALLYSRKRAIKNLTNIVRSRIFYK